MRCLLFFLLLPFLIRAQNELSLGAHESVSQSSYINPSFQAKKGLWVSLPAAAFNFGNSGFTYNDLITSDGDSAILDVPKMIGALKEKNYLFAQLHLNYLNAHYRWDDWLVGFSHSQKLSINLKYHRKLAEFLWYGNARFVGQEIDIAPDFAFYRYFETALSVSRKIENFQFGVRLKYLEGASTINSESNTLKIYTEPRTYNLSVETDLSVRMNDTSDFTSIEFMPDAWFVNPGFAFDLGATWHVTDRLTLAASVVDIGWIRWKEDVTVLSSSGKFTFSGIDLSGLVLGDTLNANEYQDSINTLINIQETSDRFTSRLVTKTYISLRYRFNERWSSSAMFYSEYLSGIHPAFSLTANRSWVLPGEEHLLNTSIHYAYRNRSFANLGAGLDYQYKFIQFFLLRDNVLSWIFPKAKVPIRYFDSNSTGSVVIPKNLKNFNFRFGINLRILRSVDEDKIGGNQSIGV